MISVHPSTRGLIFDLDGTLADTMGMHIESWIEAGHEFGVEITAAMINDNAGIPTRPLIALLNKLYGWEINPEKFEELKDDSYHRIKESNGIIQPVKPVMELLHHHKNTLPMAVGTGSIRSDALMAVNELGIDTIIKGLVTADDVENPKPHPETFLACADIIGIEPRYCQVYEDSPKGVEAALAGGMMVTNILTGAFHQPV